MPLLFTPTGTWNVDLKVDLSPGCTAEDAEIDTAALTTHSFTVQADTEGEAVEAALDEFHDAIPIGVLDYVEIATSATPKG